MKWNYALVLSASFNSEKLRRYVVDKNYITYCRVGTFNLQASVVL